MGYLSFGESRYHLVPKEVECPQQQNACVGPPPPPSTLNRTREFPDYRVAELKPFPY